MLCPNCHQNASRVIDSRPTDEGRTIRRRRECENCGYRFTTFERVEQSPLLVIKNDGTREAFSREKILNGGGGCLPEAAGNQRAAQQAGRQC